MDHWNSSVARRSPLKAIPGFPFISNHLKYRKCRFPDIGLLDMPMISCCSNIHSESSLADIGHSSADTGTISGHFWKKMNDNARSNPGSSFIFLTSHTIFVIFYYYHFLFTFFILCYMNILELLSILYTQLLIPVILLTSTVDVFVLLTGFEPRPCIYSATLTLYP